MLATLLLPAATPVAEVRLCALVPKGVVDDPTALRISGFRRMAVLQEAVRRFNNRTDVLPNTTLLLTHRDSKCHQLTALAQTVDMAQHAFAGQGCDVLIGLGCSDASKGAAAVATLQALPEIACTSTSPELSDSSAYPYFMRVPASDSMQAAGLADVIRHLLRFSHVATVALTDAYGTAGIAAFHAAAAHSQIKVLEKVTFDHGATATDLRAPDGPISKLKASGARVIVIFSQRVDAEKFITNALAEGVGGMGFTWVASEAITESHLESASFFDGLRSNGAHVGVTSLLPNPPISSAPYLDYLAAVSALPSHAGSSCDYERDDGGALMWMYDDGTALRCGGAASQVGDSYGPFIWDAAHTVAHALHKLVEVDGVSNINGAELFSALLEVGFEGATGTVSFNNGNDGEMYRGDRQAGLSFAVKNYAPSAQGAGSFESLGSWSFVSSNASWSDRFLAASDDVDAALVWATADGSRPESLGSSGDGILRLGVFCEDASTTSTVFAYQERCDRARHAIGLLNDKADGFFDDVLPNHKIVSHEVTAGCDGSFDIMVAYGELDSRLPGAAAVLGPDCSAEVKLLAGKEARNANGIDKVFISHSSTVPELAQEEAYPKLVRAVPSETWVTEALVALCQEWDWMRVAVVYDPASLWANSSVSEAGFCGNFTAAGGNVHSMLPWRGDAEDILRSLVADQARIVVLYMDAMDMRELFYSLYENRDDIELGFFDIPHAFLSPSFSAFYVDDGVVNASALYGAQGLLSFNAGSSNVEPSRSTSALYGGLWAGAASFDGCSTPGPRYCDSDTDLSTGMDYSYQLVDALLLYAKGMDRHLRSGGNSSDPDGLHSAILDLPKFDGVSGEMKLGADGDALTNLPLINLQYANKLVRLPGSRAIMTLEPVVAHVGYYHLATHLLDIPSCSNCSACSASGCSHALRFTDMSTQAPSDGRDLPGPSEGETTNVGLIIAIAVSATFALTLAVLASWRRIVNFCVKKIEQRWGLPAVKKSNQAEEERKCCSFWFVPASFVIELAEAIGEAPGPGAEGVKSSSVSNSGGNRRSKFLARYLDASTPTTTLSRCFARLQQVREATSSHPTGKVHPAADGSAPKLHKQTTSANLRRQVQKLFPSLDISQGSERGKLIRMLTDVRKSEGPAAARAVAASHLTFRALKAAGVLVRREIYVEDAFRGKYAQEYLAVSHRWMIADAPDAAMGAECAQLEAIAKHLRSQPETTRPRFVWFDFWCMPQHSRVDHTANLFVFRSMLYAYMPDPSSRLAGVYSAIASIFSLLRTYATAPAAEDEGKRKRKCRRTKLEDESFYWMLENMSTLYVGCAVLILLDRAYQSRFWTSFEAWLALRTATAEGLVNTPCPTDTGAAEGGLAQLSPRASVATVYGAPGALIQSLQEEWAMCTREEAREKLKSPDVSVSNGKDKAVQLGRWEDGKVEGCKIFELDALAQEVLAPDRSTRESEKLRRIRTAKQRRLLARAKEVSRLSQSFVRRSRED